MSTITATATSQALAEWIKVFPKQAAETYTGSVNFMKQLTVVAVSTITYMKNVFPEEDYNIESFGGVKLRILKKICKNELAQFVSTALVQASDAFEKKYLHQLAICFYSGECDPDNLVEYHMFEYTYSGEEASMNVLSRSRDSVVKSQIYSFENVKEQTMRMIRGYIVTLDTCNNQLPEIFDISIRLYYNDDAPVGYQAPGFLSPLEKCDHLAATNYARIKLGAVETRYHRLTARIYTRDLDDSNDVNPTQNPPILTENDMDFENAVDADGAPRMRCPCNKNDVDNTCPILICEYCGRGGHSVCYGLFKVPGSHCCVRCADADPTRRLSDLRLHDLQPNKRECLCIFRRALWECKSVGAVCATLLSRRLQLSQLNACKLMKLLHSYGIFLANQGDDQDLVSPRKVNREQLEQTIEKYFQKEENDIVERLLAESLTPEKESDPVGDVLKPMEKISLQNATTLGQIVEPTPPKNITENSTLQQYREAILSNEKIEEELPLSGNHNPVNVKEQIGKKSNKRKADEDKKPRIAVKTKRVRLTTK